VCNSGYYTSINKYKFSLFQDNKNKIHFKNKTALTQR
jgi:hypothetical protein